MTLGKSESAGLNEDEGDGGGSREEGVEGGFGSHVQLQLSNTGIFDHGFKFRSMVLPDTFLDQDTPKNMYENAAMSANDIEEKVLEILDIVSLKKSI